jgi:putative membrane protein
MTKMVMFGVVLLLAAWLGPLPDLVEHSFTAHMLLHLMVVAGATPLLAIGLVRQYRVARHLLGVMSPVPAALLELVVVWAWHAPGLHQAARSDLWWFVAEQASFLVAALLFWGAVAVAALADTTRQACAAVLALVMTFGHMTWLGALLVFSARPLYRHAGEAMHALEDQHLGGATMLVVSAMAYVTGGVLVGRRLLRGPAVERHA